MAYLDYAKHFTYISPLILIAILQCREPTCIPRLSGGSPKLPRVLPTTNKWENHDMSWQFDCKACSLNSHNAPPSLELQVL